MGRIVQASRPFRDEPLCAGHLARWWRRAVVAASYGPAPCGNQTVPVSQVFRTVVLRYPNNNPDRMVCAQNGHRFPAHLGPKKVSRTSGHQRHTTAFPANLEATRKATRAPKTVAFTVMREFSLPGICPLHSAVARHYMHYMWRH